MTWPFYNVYLGIVMVYDAVDPPNTYGKGKVHCELVGASHHDIIVVYPASAPACLLLLPLLPLLSKLLLLLQVLQVLLLLLCV